MAKTNSDVESVVTGTSVDAVADYKARAEADFDPVETAQARLERLEAETKQLRADIRSDERAAADSGVVAAIDALTAEIHDKLMEIQELSGSKVFRAFSFYYTRKNESTPETMKTKFRLARPRIADSGGE